MTAAEKMDIVMLVPGNDEYATFDALLSSRKRSLRVRDVRYEILKHPRRDPGCFHEAPGVLQPYQNRAHYALVVLDHEGSGQEERTADEIAADLGIRMAQSGWSTNRTAVLVLQPELENWVWSDSSEVARAIGWTGQNPSLRRWLMDRGVWPQGEDKPSRPKECFEFALREARTKRSSAIYRELAEKVGLQRCQDQGFHAFLAMMRKWFPAQR